MTNWAGCSIRRVAEVDSTNRVARAWAREGAPHGAVVIANRQTAGRGRRGRQWSSAPDMGLWLSIIIRPKVEVQALTLLPLAAALAAADACTAASGAAVQIKWPNDILLEGRKLVGILVELEGSAAVIGIGINVRQQPQDFPPELQSRAGSLEMLTGHPVSMETLEQSLLLALEQYIDAWDFLPAYRTRCTTLGSAVQVVEVNGTFTGTAEGLDDTGALLVRDETSTLRRIWAADVSVRGLENGV